MEIGIDEFLSLPEIGGEKAKKVDWSKVLEEIKNRPMTVGEIRAIAQAYLNQPDKKIYYSEITGWLTRLNGRVINGEKIVVLKRFRENKAVYLVTTEEVLSRVQGTQGANSTNSDH